MEFKKERRIGFDDVENKQHSNWAKEKRDLFFCSLFFLLLISFGPFYPPFLYSKEKGNERGGCVNFIANDGF